MPWACKKENKGGLISGHVYEHGTQRPVAGAKIRLYSGDGDVGGSEILTLLDTASTDSDGVYRFEGVPPGDWFELTAVKQRYFVPNEPTYLNSNEETADFYLFPFAWMMLHIQNSEMSDSWERSTVWADYGRDFRGLVDTTFVVVVEGNKSHNFAYKIETLTSSVYADTVLYFPAFDTIKVEVIY